MVVTRAASFRCMASEVAMRKRQKAVANGTLPLGFPVVIIPPLRQELGNGQWSKMHAYSDLYDLAHQLKYTMRYRNCYITDKPTFVKLKRQGLLLPVNGEAKLEIQEIRVSPYRFKGPELHRVYQGLAMSSRLRKL